MSLEFTYSLSADFGGQLNVDDLSEDIGRAITDVALAGITIIGDVVTIQFDATLDSGNETALTSVISSYVYVTSDNIVKVATITPFLSRLNTPDYRVLSVYNYLGRRVSPSVERIRITSYMDNNVTSYQFRVVNITNKTVLYESPVLTNTDEGVYTYDTDIFPYDNTVLEFQGKRTGGTNQSYAYVRLIELLHVR